MALLTDQTIADVKHAIDFGAIVGDFTDLPTNAGVNPLVRCPFHEDSTPSCRVHLTDNVFRCHGCGESGSAVDFYAKASGLSFPDAIRALAERFNVEVAYVGESEADRSRRVSRRRLLDLAERAATFYHRALIDSDEASVARAELARRGFTRESIERFRLGFAPAGERGLLEAAQAAGFSIDELDSIGIAAVSRRGGHYDRFYGRLIFPVCDLQGAVRGFAGRALSDRQTAKYINSPESPIFTKGDLVYGLALAQKSISERGRVIVAEGYTDVIALHQAGFTEAVGPMGTALTSRQGAAIGEQSRSVFVAYDGDSSGRDGGARAAEVLTTQSGAVVRMIELPAGVDPCELLADEAVDFERFISDACELFPFRVRSVLTGRDRSTPESREAVVDELAPLFAASPAGPARHHQLECAALELGLPVDELRSALIARSG